MTFSTNILYRRKAALLPLTPHQTQVDGLVGGFAEQATDWRSLAAMTAGGLAYRAGRIGVMGLASGHGVRALSIGLGLGAEVSAFELTHRVLQTTNSNLWRWSGPNGLAQGLLQSFITFGALKSAGRLSQGQNLIAQHLFQDTAMVFGHQVSGVLGIAPRPTGSLAEQFLHSEATNLQIGAGMALGHRFAQGVQALERGLDLSIQNAGAGPWNRPQLDPQTGNRRGLPLREPALANIGAEGSGRGPAPLDFILAMSSTLEGDGTGSPRPPPPRIFNALPRRGKKGTPSVFNLNPIPRQRWEAPNQINVNEFGISEGGILITRGLTSCAALLFYDAARRTGVMMHLQPPEISRGLKISEIGPFIQDAIERALNELGGETKNVTAMTLRSRIDPFVPKNPTWSDSIFLSLKKRAISVHDLPLHAGIAEIQFNTASGEVKVDPFPSSLQNGEAPFPILPRFLPPHESFPINLRGYSIMEGQSSEPAVDLWTRPLGDDLFRFEGFGFLIFQGARGRSRNNSLIYCSRLTIFDPITRIAVDSHLPVYYDDFEVFKSDLQLLLRRLRGRGMSLENSQANLIFGRVVKDEDFQGRYPGEMAAELVKEAGLPLVLVFPADRNYDLNLETGELVPAPEGE